VSAPRCGTLGTRVPLIGLIGPIGCGKSTVAGWLAARGAAVIDADALTREIMAPGTPVADAIVARFGGEFRRPDGSLDRARPGPPRLRRPGPPGRARVDRPPRRCGSPGGFDPRGRLARPAAIVLEAIKLVEAGHAPWCDEVWLVICDPETQLVRLTGRGMDEPDARQRIAARPPRSRCGVPPPLARFAPRARVTPWSAPSRPRSRRLWRGTADPTRLVGACPWRLTWPGDLAAGTSPLAPRRWHLAAGTSPLAPRRWRLALALRRQTADAASGGAARSPVSVAHPPGSGIELSGGHACHSRRRAGRRERGFMARRSIFGISAPPSPWIAPRGRVRESFANDPAAPTRRAPPLRRLTSRRVGIQAALACAPTIAG